MSKFVGAMALSGVLGLVAVAAAPAGAAPAGGGPVNGTVSVASPGITLDPTTTRYTFNSIVLTGSFTDGSNAFAGQINVVDVKGGSNVNAESTTSGEGYVEQFSLNGTGVGSTITGSCIGADHINQGPTDPQPSSGSAFTAGGYSRVGSIVLVKLMCSTNINGAGATPAQPVYVAAQFSPTQGDGVTTGVTEANFAGAYATGAELF